MNVIKLQRSVEVHFEVLVEAVDLAYLLTGGQADRLPVLGSIPNFNNRTSLGYKMLSANSTLTTKDILMKRR